MKKITYVNPESANPKWNSVCTHPMQTIEWAKVRSSHGLEILMVEQYENENLEAVFLATIHKIPYTKYKIAYIPKSQVPNSETFSAIGEFAKNKDVIFVKFEPNVLVEEKIQIPTNLTRSLHPIFTKHNQLLELNKSEEDLLTSFHSKTRYNIKLAQKKGVEVREMSNSEGYKIFEKLYFETCARQKYRGHTPKYHEKIWAMLGSKSDPMQPSLNSKIVVAFYNSSPLAAYQLWHFKDKMYYVYGGSSILYKEVMAANLLMWKSILIAKNVGCTVFDMWGSLSKDYDRKDPWAGFTRFKEGYGTRFVEYIGSYDMIINMPLYKIYGLAHSIRQKII